MDALLSSTLLKYNTVVAIQRTLLAPFIFESRPHGLVPCIWEALAFLPSIIVVTAVPVVIWLIWEVAS